MSAKINTVLNYFPYPLKRHKVIRSLVHLFPSLRYHKFLCDGNTVVSNLMDAAARQAFITNHFEDYGYFALAEKILPKNGVHFDVGANYGFHTFGLLNRLQGRNVQHHLFEPNKDCVVCHKLSAEINSQHNIKINKLATSDTTGSFYFSFCKENSGGGSIYYDKDESVIDLNAKNPSEYEVQGITIDQYLSDNHLDTVHLMKVDVEGSEMRVIQGAESTLNNGKINSIYMEINSAALLSHKTAPIEVIQALESFGYCIFYPHTNSQNNFTEIELNNNTLNLAPFDIQTVLTEKGNQVILMDILAIHESIIKQSC